MEESQAGPLLRDGTKTVGLLAAGACGVCLCFVVFMAPAIALSITSIVLSTQDIACNHMDPMGLDVSDYLLGSGIAGLMSFILILGTFYSFFNETPTLITLSLSVLLTLFSLSWFIVGGIILFRSNIDCINEGTPEVIYALVMWCLSAFVVVSSCCSKKSD